MWNFLRRKRDAALLITILFFCLLALWIAGKTFVTGPREIGMVVTSAAQQVANSIGSFFSNTVLSIQKLVDLRKEYDLIVQKLQMYESQQTNLDQLRAENENLKIVLKFSTSSNYLNIASQVIGKSPGVLFSTITINKGFNDGVVRGMSVIGYQDGIQGLVGKIESVSSSSSQVRPLTSEELFVAARLENSRFEGLVHGQGNAALPVIMQYVDFQAENAVAIGEPVITAGLNSEYPSGIRIGIVSGINAKAFDNSLELEIRPSIIFSKLEYVYILQEKAKE
jgi:rod shape-determining protein MreC